MSVFKEEAKTNGATKDSPEVMKTGGEVDVIVSAFLPHSYDRDESVRAAYTFALVDMGNKQPALLLSSLTTFLSKNPKLDLQHRIQLINSVEKIISMKRESVNEVLAEQLIRFLVREMIKDMEPVNELSQPCSSSLVLLSVPYCPIVLDQLLAFFKHGEVPHYYLIKTLSDVATANGIQFTLRLTDILTRSTPCLGTIKKAPMRWVFATALGHYAEALQHFLINADEDLKAQVNSKTFELEFLSSFDILFQKWLTDSPEAKVRFSILESLGYMSSCLERSAFETRLPKVIPKFLEMYKKEKMVDHLPISQGLYWVVNEASKSKEAIEPLLPALLQSLHPLLCKAVDFSQPVLAKNHNEMLRIMEILARVELDMTLNFIVNRFQLKEKETRIGSLIILRHLVNSMDPLLMDKRPLIMSSVITMVNEQDLNVKKAMMQLIVSMSNQNYLAMEGGQALVRFIIQQCALAVDEQEKTDGKDGKGDVR